MGVRVVTQPVLYLSSDGNWEALILPCQGEHVESNDGGYAWRTYLLIKIAESRPTR